MHAESINLRETQCSKNDLMPSHSEANDEAAPPNDTVLHEVMILPLHQMHQTMCKSPMSLDSVLEGESKNCPGD